MRLSISAKIFAGFLVVLGIFGAVTTYDAFAMRRLGDELRLVSRGYLELQLGVANLQSSESNLLKVLVDQLNATGSSARLLPFVKFAMDGERRARLTQQMPAALSDVAALEALRSSPEEHALLRQIRTRLQHIEISFRANEELFDEAFGPIGDSAMALAPITEARKAAAERLVRREQNVKRDLAGLSAELRLRTEEAGLRLEREETRAVWAILLLAVAAALIALFISALATRTLRPLRTLAERAREVARGDYKQRVEASSPDEIGALGREFNAMAAALDEREQALIRSERLAAIGKIAAQITHEVRNPLSSIGLNAELLEESISQLGGGVSAIDLPEMKAIAQAIVKEVDRLTEITEGYLRFARLPRPKLEREALPAIVASLVAFLRGELESRGVAVEVRVAGPLPSVAADEHQLRQALLNLLRNAGEAMAAGGRLTLAMALAGDFVELTIADNGQGIAPEHLAKIFNPFFSTKDGGTGLGLALTQQIIVEHGGSITVASEPGRGTIFTVRLPATPDEPDELPAAALALDGARE